MIKPTLHSHTITHNLIVFNGVRECFAFAKPHQPTLKPKLGGSVCLFQRTPKPTEKPTDVEEARCPNMRLASCGVKWLNSSAVFQINFSAGLTVSCPE